MPSKPLYSEAVLVLARAGITLQAVGNALDLTRQSVSLQLSGQRRAHPALVPVVRALGGPGVAKEVAEILVGDRGVGE